jgi:nucleoside-diphosphate-sugar epimerase
MKILLTGATGFLGSKLTKRLLKDGHNIFILKRSFSDTSRILTELKFINSFDVDLIPLSDIFSKNDFDLVLHLATNYGRGGQSIYQMANDNILFSINLLEESINSGVPKFINIDTLLKKNISNYTLCKKQFVEWGNFISKNQNIKFINVKLEHLYGPGDDKNKFVYWLVDKMLKGEPEIKLTDGLQKRDFIFIDDAISALNILINERELKYIDYEIGTGSPISVKSFVLLLKSSLEQFTGEKVSSFFNFGAIPRRANEQRVIKADISKLKELGWGSEVQLNEGISRLINEIRIK